MSKTKLEPPIGFLLHRSAKAVARTFERYLFGETGGALTTWLVLLALQDGDGQLQTDLAAFAGIQGPTLVHHLNKMESDGLIVRTRTRGDRRVHRVTINPAGQRLFDELKNRAKAFDFALREALNKSETALLRDLMQKLVDAARRLETTAGERK